MTIWGMSESQTNALLWMAGAFLVAKIAVWMFFGFVMWMNQ